MGEDNARPSSTTRVLVRVILYYIVLIGIGTLIWQMIPHSGSEAPASLDSLFGGGPNIGGKYAPSKAPLDEVTLAISVGVAMLSAILLSLPVAWIYLLTRSKRGYQQSVVQLLIILPLIVSGIVLLVKYSVALAFSLAGIVAAVRFRNTLDDSKDAVYVFLATAIGMASAVNVPVAAVISIAFNATVFALWYMDFGHAPEELDGRIADKRLKRARELARTGTFVARIDDEVLQNMSRDQLAGVAERALRRAHASEDEAPSGGEDRRLRIKTDDPAGLRPIVEAKLKDYTKQYRRGSVTEVNGEPILEFFVQLRKKTSAEDLTSLIRLAGMTKVIDIELV
jgi:hypothetical protein